MPKDKCDAEHDNRACTKGLNHRGWHMDDSDKGQVVEWIEKSRYKPDPVDW